MESSVVDERGMMSLLSSKLVRAIEADAEEEDEDAMIVGDFLPLLRKAQSKDLVCAFGVKPGAIGADVKRFQCDGNLNVTAAGW